MRLGPYNVSDIPQSHTRVRVVELVPDNTIQFKNFD
jgi:hypothetical protein